MKNISIFILAVSFLVVLNIRNNNSTKTEENTNSAFIEQIHSYCGKIFKGKMIFPDDPLHNFANKDLEIHIKYCSKDSVRIPFSVGNDKSRTWILTKTSDKLLLKHDHRHSDGSPDSLTMYGGYSDNGTKLMQQFAADDYTAALIPAAATNVWTMQIDPEKNLFHYILHRDGKLRFHAVFDMN